MTYETNGLNGTGPIHFTNVRILDASGEYSYTGEVVVQGNRIKQITRGSSRLAPASGGHSDTVIDGMGATLMPGLIDAHLHLSWNNAPGIDPIQMMELEEHMLVTMEMAKLVLDAGFTAGRGAAAAKPRLDVVAKRFINEGRFPGPRYLAAGPEITTVGGLGDAAPSHIPHEGLNLGIVVSGPEEVRRTVRQLIKYGVNSIKLNLSGEEITGMGAEETPMSEEEVAMAVKEAKCRNKVLSAHARSSGSVKQCVRHGIQNIYHASFADEEALDMLEANKDAAFRRSRHRLAHQHRALRRAVGHQARIEGGDTLRARARNVRRDHEEDAPARHPDLHRRRLWVCLDAARHQRQRHPDLRRDAGLHADGSDPGRDQIRRRDHGYEQ